MVFKIQFVLLKERVTELYLDMSRKYSEDEASYMADHANRFYGVFWKRRVWYISCFLPHPEIMILTKVISGRRFTPIVMRNSIARTILNHDYPKLTILLTSRTIFSCIFWAIILKLSRYVLGMKIKIYFSQIFIQALTEIMEFLNFFDS